MTAPSLEATATAEQLRRFAPFAVTTEMKTAMMKAAQLLDPAGSTRAASETSAQPAPRTSVGFPGR